MGTYVRITMLRLNISSNNINIEADDFNHYKRKTTDSQFTKDYT